MGLVLSVVLGYLLGSVPFALVIGKVFYKTDIRKFGSGNLGGGNAGRVLGKKAGVAVMTMDILKVTLAVFLVTFFSGNEAWMAAAGLAAAMGHCFPVFAGFKGGKAVAVMYGFLLGMALCTECSLLLFLLPLAVFLLILYLWKIIALASIGSAVFVTVYSFFAVPSRPVFRALLVFTAVIIWRHRKNIERIIAGNENKITWM